MQKLANIVTKSRNAKFDNIYNVVGSCEEIIDGLPTLYIGLETARACIEGFDILTKAYPKQNIWWTFSKTERRSDYLRDTESFQNTVLRQRLRNIRYEYLDFTRYTVGRLKKLISYLRSDRKKYCFLTRSSRFVFIYVPEREIVMGLSLTLCDYTGINRYKVVRKIKEEGNNEFVYDTTFLSPETRRIIGDDTHYLLPLYTYLSE